jgi:hypothetical protein
VVRRRSGQYAGGSESPAPLGFNPNEPAPPKPSPRPHSVYRMEGSTPPNRYDAVLDSFPNPGPIKF